MAAALSYLVTRTGGRSAGRRPLASLTGRHLNLPETETPAAPYFQNKRGRQAKLIYRQTRIDIRV